MSELRKLLACTDDDYLIGISNKGIVKRAYKDLEGATPVVTWEEESASVSLGEETCRICVPLGESSCSCPSRSICRHVVSAILWLKAQGGMEDVKQEKDTVAEEPKEEKGIEAAGEPKEEKDVEVAKKPKEEKGIEVAGKPIEEKDIEVEKKPKEELNVEAVETEREITETKLLPPKQELLDVPLKKLRIACGTKRYRMFCQKLKTGEKPELIESSTVTVTFLKEEIKVKLLEPLSYSTCSCHSKELCSHKAEAILWYQIETGKLKKKEVEKELEADKTWDKDQIKELAISIKEVIKEQFLTGLSRMSLTAEDTMERMAMICHEGKLPEFENRFRQLKGDYELYFTRNISFETGSLRKKFLELYHRADKLEHADTMEEISRLAGEFRDVYEPVGDLKLMGIGQRHFKSKSGYEGETYYFLELDTADIYTWTDARPTFYEGRKRTPQAGIRMEAPWGLMCNREEMTQMMFHLSNAKSTKDNKLSVSKETKGEVVEEGNYNHPIFDDLIACNFEELLKEQFSKGMQEENNQLVFVKAEQIGEAEFDSVNQVFHMELFDTLQNKIYVTVHYTPEEKFLIQTLEKMQERIKKNGNRKKVFFGRLYLEDGKCHLYPIECFDSVK